MDAYYIFNKGKRVGSVYAKSYTDAFLKCNSKYGESVAIGCTISKDKELDKQSFWCEMAGYSAIEPKWDFNNQKGSCTKQCDECKLMVANNE